MMTVLVSPTKQMDFRTPLSPPASAFLKKRTKDRPRFKREADSLIKLCQAYDETGLAGLMKISPAIAEDTAKSIRSFNKAGNPARAALFTYSGTVFSTMNPYSLGKAELIWADEHLRILSGLYGLLKPMDEIQPYRLEMKTGLSLPEGKTLTSFWKDRIMDALPEGGIIINLASGEYSRALDRTKLKDRMVNFSFKEISIHPGGESPRTVGMYAKTARGIMLKRILEEKTENPEKLCIGETGGYRYSPEYSKEKDWVFVRAK